MERQARLTSIDALRGVVMILMAIDHVRDFVHVGATSNPTNLATTTVALFLTRWVTHFVAPAFMFAAGLGAWFYGRSRTKGELSRFLVTRGLWLMMLEVTVMRLAYNFSASMGYPWFLLVLWGLGLSMVALAALARLPFRAIVATGAAMILLHNTLDGVAATSFGSFSWLWNLLHQPGAYVRGSTVLIFTYPLIPWAGVMALGYCAGKLWELEPARRQQLLMRIGVAATVAFIALRAANVYGDPSKWASQPTAAFTVLSFLNTTKYAPSLLFLLMTLGPALILLAWLDRRGLARDHPLVVLGRVPLFYFVAHFALAHAVSVVLALTRYGSAAWGFAFYPPPAMGIAPEGVYPTPFGYSLGVTYLVWAGIVVALYPACRWWAGVKERRREWWMTYL